MRTHHFPILSCLFMALCGSMAVHADSEGTVGDYDMDGAKPEVVPQKYREKARRLSMESQGPQDIDDISKAQEEAAKERIKAMSSGPIVNTTNGPVQGVSDEKYNLFLGIRFGASPTGNLRFRPPQKPEPWWNHVKDASWFGNSCPQDDFFSVLTETSEDCLFLNVYTPANATKGSDIPVILFFYGGSWTGGSASFFLYWANQDISDVEDVIFVTANYRLKAFGYLASEALRAESPDGSVGNYGFKDQRFAMEWIRDNIRNFGGDPNTLTIQGESAGAGSVSGHLVSPASGGLFQRAIMESGPFAIWIAQPYHVSNLKYDGIVKNSGCNKTSNLRNSGAEILKCLRGLTTKQILQASKGIVNGLVEWSPVIDGVEIPDFPQILAAQGKIHNVPVLLGSNRDEGTLFTEAPHDLSASDYKSYLEKRFGNATFGAEVANLYPPANYKSPWWAVSHVIGDAAMTCAVRRSARWLTGRANAEPVYPYFFQHELEVVKLFVPYKGVFHGSELAFVFDLKLGLWTKEERALALQFVRYWTRFARTGNPNGGSDFHWPAYSNSSDTLLVLDTPKVFNETNLKNKVCNFWDNHHVPWKIVWGVKGSL